VRALWRDAVAAGREFGGEFRVVRPGGEVRWVELQAGLFRDPGSGGAATGYVGALSDITERKRAESLSEQKEAAEAALSVAEEGRRAAEEVNRAKSQFLANMSHELRTPLNAIIGFSEILQDQTAGGLTPKQARYVDNVLTSGRHLLQLINDVLDLSKIEAGRMTLEYARFAPSLAIRDVRNVVVALANKKSQSIRLDVPEELPAVEGDQGKFKQILYNLLSNAVKFTPEGKAITVSASADEQAGRLTVAVRDEGIGLRPEHHERVFGEFEQVDSSYARAQQGTGLGLALTRRFVEMHGGRIWVESEGEGKGSTFLFTLPLRRPRPEGAAPEAPASVPFAERPSVLVVDDDRASSELMRQHLERAGYRVAQVYRAGDAVPAARELRPNAITLDVQLPDRDGWTALNALKTDPATAEIPVVVVSVTEAVNGAAAKPAAGVGAVACFVKPVDRDRLIGTIEAFASAAGDARRPRVLVVDDDPRTVEMLAHLMGKRGFEVVSALGGREALERAVAERPDVIVLDLMMPEVSGFDVVEHLRSRPDLSGIPVLVYTANDISEEARDRLARQVLASAGRDTGDGAALVAELGRVLAASERGPAPKAL
jgi:signal transduction histidine kinase/CheY-like chemotaxis protein